MSCEYRWEVENDIKQYIDDNYEVEDLKARIRSGELILDELYDEMWTADSVTGNGSGSYTFNRWQAEENLSHNWSYIIDCAEYFGYQPIISEDWEYGAEWWDVAIRCMILSEVFSEVMEKILGDIANNENINDNNEGEEDSD